MTKVWVMSETVIDLPGKILKTSHLSFANEGPRMAMYYLCFKIKFLNINLSMCKAEVWRVHNVRSLINTVRNTVTLGGVLCLHKPAKIGSIWQNIYLSSNISNKQNQKEPNLRFIVGDATTKTTKLGRIKGYLSLN